jgi:hypothetical protein
LYAQSRRIGSVAAEAWIIVMAFPISRVRSLLRVGIAVRTNLMSGQRMVWQ